MNSTIAKLADEFEKMEKTIASQKKMIETLMPTGYVDTDTVKLHLNSVYGVMFGSRPSLKRYKLEDCSWDEINMYSSIGLADKVFEVGDTKKFRLADGSYLTARIIGFNHDYAEDGSLTHITFETVETLDGNIPMNEKSTNEGGWDASYLRAKLNGNFFEKQLPADLKAVIKPVVKITAKSGKNEILVTSVDKLFVLSEQEVFGRKIYSCGGEGKKAAIAQFRDGDKKVSIAGSAYNWEVSRTSTTKIDKDAMKADGILAKYTTTEDSYRISPKIIKED